MLLREFVRKLRVGVAAISGRCPDCFMTGFDQTRHDIIYSDILQPWSVKNRSEDFILRAAVQCRTCGRNWGEAVAAATLPAKPGLGPSVTSPDRGLIRDAKARTS